MYQYAFTAIRKRPPNSTANSAAGSVGVRKFRPGRVNHFFSKALI
jgi:hypothetical protein